MQLLPSPVRGLVLAAVLAVVTGQAYRTVLAQQESGEGTPVAAA